MLRGYARFFTASFVGGYLGSRSCSACASTYGRNRRGSWFRASGREAESPAEEFR